MRNMKYISVLLGVVFVHCTPNGTAEEQTRHDELKNIINNNSTEVKINNVTEAGKSSITTNGTTLKNISSIVKLKRRVLIVNIVERSGEKVNVSDPSSNSTSAERRNGDDSTKDSPGEPGSENGNGSDKAKPDTEDGKGKEGGEGKEKGKDGKEEREPGRAGKDRKGKKGKKKGKNGKGGKGGKRSRKESVHTLLYQEYNDANEVLQEFWMRSLEDVVQFFQMYLDTTICQGQCSE